MGPNNGVVVYLTRSSEQGVRQLEQSLALLAKNFLPWSPADVVVFHEADLNPAILDGRTSGIGVRFACVDFTAVPEAMKGLSKQQRGYRHMCHFFANDIFLRPELEGYRYYMRMDDDSYILSPLRENVFAVMSTHAYRYAYRVIVKDKPQYCRGLWARAEAYFTESSSAIRPFSEVTPCGAFYTNFEICDLAWFQSEPWQGFFRVIDEAGGIWRHRWGDHVIRFIGVKALVPDSQLRCVVQMHYRHQSEWRSGYKRRLPHDMLRYYAWLSWMLVRAWLARRT